MSAVALLVTLALAAVLMIFGALCVNYTKPSSVEHHRQWAEESGAPGPSDGMLAGGVMCFAAGVGLFAFFGRRRP